MTIKRPIVFVLGAGASIPYGLPSGADLRARICAATTEPDKNGLGQIILRLGNVKDADLRKFGLAFSRSGIESIDAFLARRPEYADLGKIAIAATLGMFENENALFSDSTTDHWYRLLWNTLIRDANEPADITRNAVRFVTFNYDRSLECFLHESIKHSFGLSDDQAAAIVKKLPILHVYGLIAPFAAQPTPGHSVYATPLSEESIQLAAKSIMLIPEQRDDKIFVEARKWFGWAERICFLGFGFDPLNMHRLGLYSVVSWKREHAEPVPGVYATTLGRTPTEVSADRLRLCGDEGWRTFDYPNSRMLRESGLLLG